MRVAGSDVRGSLFWRLMWGIGSVVLSTLLLSMLVLGAVSQGVLHRQVSQHMLQSARGMAAWASPYMESDFVPDDFRPHIGWLTDVADGRLWVVNQEGLVVIDAHRGDRQFQGAHVRHPWLAAVLAGETLEKAEPDPWLGSTITVGYPIQRDGRVVGAVFVFLNRTRLMAILSDYTLPILLSVLISAAIGLLAAYTLSRLVAQPIEQMSRFAAFLGKKRIPVDLRASNIRELDQLRVSLQSASLQVRTSYNAIVEEKQRIQSLIQEMADGVVAVSQEGRVLLCNPAAIRFLDLPGPCAGECVVGLGMPVALEEALLAACSEAAQGPVSLSFSLAGLELHAHVSPVIAGAARPSGAVALIKDVSADVQLQRLRENFVANVSHELRGPLASLQASLEAMHDGLIPTDARPRYFRSMLSELARLHRLTEDLLELSSLDAGMLQVPLEEFDLRPLAEGLMEKWVPRCAAAGLSLTVDCGHIRVLANYDRVEEILSNFLDNAVRFTPPGGAIRLQAREAGEGRVQISVADNGIGIGPEHLPHIWDRFYKVDPARPRTRGSGTGLGLAIVWHLAERLGGTVKVESTEGQGSVFSLYVRSV